MDTTPQKLYFSGYCYWSMEAVFSHLRGVNKVHSGWGYAADLGIIEAVRIIYSPDKIHISSLIEIHLYMHRSDYSHGIKKRYPTAIYSPIAKEILKLQCLIDDISKNSDQNFFCKSRLMSKFQRVEPGYDNYYLKDPKKPYCQRYIRPKLDELKTHWPEFFTKKDLISE